MQEGDPVAGQQLVRDSLIVMEGMPVSTLAVHGFGDVMAHLVVGDVTQAMAAPTLTIQRAIYGHQALQGVLWIP